MHSKAISLTSCCAKVSSKLQGKKAVIVVDGLDEVDTVGPAVNPLDLPMVLPNGICVFVTLRKDTKRPRADNSVIFADGPHSALNVADVQAYVEQALTDPGIKSYITLQKVTDAEFVDLMVKKSEGNFMYLRYVIPEMSAELTGIWRSQALPAGLRNYYEDHWDRMRSGSVTHGSVTNCPS